jgi:hypothetical protein
MSTKKGIRRARGTSLRQTTPTKRAYTKKKATNEPSQRAASNNDKRKKEGSNCEHDLSIPRPPDVVNAITLFDLERLFCLLCLLVIIILVATYASYTKISISAFL